MVDYELFELYESALAANTTLLSRSLRTLSQEVDGMGGGNLRSYLGGRYPSLVRAHGMIAAEAAREFYDAQRAMSEAAEAFGDYEAMLAYPDDLAAEISAQVNTASKDVVQAVAEKVFDFLESRGIQDVMRCADATLERNASRDPAHPKWALVPHFNACSWCIMIASRGFVYGSADKLSSQRHDRCKCTSIVDFDVDNPALLGYDPDRYYRIWKKMEEIDAMDDLRYGEIKSLRLAAIDSEIPLIDYERVVFSDSMNGCIKRAWNSYKKDKTETRYEADINRFLSKVGDIYGIELRGQYLSGKGKASAYPSGDEVFAVVQRRDLYKSVEFQGTIKGRGGDADILADGVYMDVKVPQRTSKVGKRLNHGAEQCRAMGQDYGVVLLSDLRFEQNFADAIRVAEEFVESGTLSKVHIAVPWKQTIG